MDVSEGHCHGVRSVARWRIRESEKTHHHVVDLLFLCASVTDNGGFDLRRTVRGHFELVASQNRKNHAPALGERETGLGIEAAERRLHRGAVRRELFDYL